MVDFRDHVYLKDIKSSATQGLAEFIVVKECSF